MLPLEKILAPLDFSQRSPGAAHYAKTLASRFRSEVILIHAVPLPDYAIGGVELSGPVPGDWQEGRMAEAKRHLDSFLAAEFAGTSVRRFVVEGDPATKILCAAREEGVDLIVMPTHGYGPFRRFILGSVTAKVLHDAAAPVLTGVHMEGAPAPGAIVFGNVLCAIDLLPESMRALSWASQFAAEFGAKLHVVHAVPELQMNEGAYFDPDWRQMLATRAREQVDELLGKAGIQAEVLIESGSPPRVVHSAAGNSQADLVVIGRHSATGLMGRLRTNAYAIIRESPCPVVSV